MVEKKYREIDLFDFTSFLVWIYGTHHNLKILGVSTDELSAEVGAKEAWELIESRRNFFELYHGEYYAMMNLIRLLDGMVGNDPLIGKKHVV